MAEEPTVQDTDKDFYLGCLKKYYENVAEIDKARSRVKNDDNANLKNIEIDEVKNVEIAYQNAWKDFNIIWGYYIYLNNDTKSLEYFTDAKSSVNSGSVFSGFTYQDIPIRQYYKEEGSLQIAELPESVRFENKNYAYLNQFSSKDGFPSVPTPYKTFCRLGGNCDDNVLSYVPKKDIREEENFYYILAEEILFFVSLYNSFDSSNSLRFRFFNQKLCDENIKSDANEFPNLSLALTYANKVVIDSEHIENLIVSDGETSKKLLGERLQKFKETNGIDNKEDVQNMARFNIEASIKFLEANGDEFTAHDLFVFPMVIANQPATQFFHNGSVIKEPLLFCAFIETLYVIEKDTRKLYESEETLKGFKVTEMMCDHISKSLVESLYYGKIINKFRAIELVKAQKSAIMGRNMSHNIGSHVLYYLKNSLTNWDAIIDAKVIHNLIQVDDHGNIVLNEETKRKDVPFLFGLGKFINYLQERQDFIATISTDFIPSGVSVDFKEAVFDEINYDLRALRHLEESAPEKHNILLEYIAKSEKYTRKNIQIKFGNYTGLEAKLSKDKLGWPAPLNSMKDELKLRNLKVAIPGGTVGRQAFFSIIENIIRNSCKHGGYRELFKLTFDIIDPDLKSEKESVLHDYNQLLIDHFFAPSTAYNKSEYFIFTITDDVPSELRVIESLQQNLSDPLINQDTLIANEKYKGLKEIKISASWLIRKNYDDNDLSYLKVDGVKIENSDKYYIRYSFLIKKPTECLIVRSSKDVKKLENDTNFYDMLILHKDIIGEVPNPHTWSNKVYVVNKKEYDSEEEIQMEALKNKLNEQYQNESITFEVVLKKDTYTYSWGSDSANPSIRLLARDHLNSGTDFKDFSERYKSTDSTINFLQGDIAVDFAEVVTGHNSTKAYYTQFIEKENLDDAQKSLRSLKTIEAALSHIFIIDERLFEGNLAFPKAKEVTEVFSHFDELINARREEFLSDSVNDINSLVDILRFNFKNEAEVFISDIAKIEEKVQNIVATNRIERFELVTLFNCLQQFKIISSGLATFLLDFHTEELLSTEVIKDYDLVMPGKEVVDNFNRLTNPLNGFYRLKNIVIADIDFESKMIINNKLKPIGRIDFNDFNKTLTLYFNDTVKKNIDILSIHQGLLDKHIPFKNFKSEEPPYRFEISPTNKSIDTLKFIHSGRGKHHTLPLNTGFLLLTQIEYALHNSKLDLYNLLCSTKITS